MFERHFLCVLNQSQVENIFSSSLVIAKEFTEVSIVSMEPGVVPTAKQWVTRGDFENDTARLVAYMGSGNIANIITVINVACTRR